MEPFLIRVCAVVLHGDPLHVAAMVRTSRAQGNDVVHVIATAHAFDLAGAGAGVVGSERAYLRA